MRADLCMRQMKQQIRWTQSWPEYCSAPLNATHTWQEAFIYSSTTPHIHMPAHRALLHRHVQTRLTSTLSIWAGSHSTHIQRPNKSRDALMDIWKVMVRVLASYIYQLY